MQGTSFWIFWLLGGKFWCQILCAGQPSRQRHDKVTLWRNFQTEGLTWDLQTWVVTFVLTSVNSSNAFDLHYGCAIATGGTGEKKTFHVHMLSTYCHFMNALYHKTSAAPKSSDGEPASTWVSGMQSSLKIALPFLVGVGSFVNYRASEHVFEGLPRFIHHWPGFSRIVGQNLRRQFVEDENLTKLFVNIRDCMFAFAYVGIFRP